MTPKHFVAVGLRLFALWLVWESMQIFAAASAIKRINAPLGDSPLWMALPLMILFLMAAFLIWIFSAPLASTVLSGVPVPQNPTVSLGHLIVAGCVLMGLWWLKDAVMSLASLWFRAIVMSRLNEGSAFDLIGDMGKVNTVLYLVQIVCGLFFVLRPFAIAHWIIRAAPSSQVCETNERPAQEQQ